jgi:hypothetical protein
MEVKEWLTVGTLIATIISSHWLVSKQARKTKKAKWIDDFKIEISKLLSLCYKYDKTDAKSGYDLITGCFSIMILINVKIESHKLLDAAISDLLKIVQNQSLENYTEASAKVYLLAKEIIRESERNL